MKLLTVLVLCGVLFLLKATTFAAGEGELDSATVSQTHFAASDTGFAPRSKMTGINFGMNLRGDPFVTSTEFGLRNIGMNTEGYIDTWEAGFGRMSVLDRITNAPTALSHKRIVWLLILGLISIAFALVAWRWVRQSVGNPAGNRASLNPNKPDHRTPDPR